MKNTLNKEKIVLSINGTGTIGFLVQKYKPTHKSCIFYKNQFKIIFHNLNVSTNDKTFGR